ncbi:MAG: hypothetical protein DCC88_08220 [Spirobacillus cienkowskii]|jgi:thermolabile hemolysin|uniref:SGNH/GDSL hydrolase family protein n=1 Tax=Spirobacillus cienkowskii TaxID=495820 RepID=A0A369KSL4_9BACT|nr:MAG: hypothetical protein DCC88_08220 [Spirobacillus cienkowskii]
MINGFVTTDISNKNNILNYCNHALNNLSQNYLNTVFRRLNFSLYDVRAFSSGTPTARYHETIASGESIVNFIYHPIRYLNSQEIREAASTIEIPQKTPTQIIEIETNQALIYPPEEKVLPNHIKQIVIFGDSLSDQGNLKYKTGHIPDFPYWFGRFSDGFIWPDYLFKATQIPILNFSYGGATTIDYKHKFVDGIKLWGQALITGNLENYLNYFNKEISVSNTSFREENLEQREINHNVHDTLYIIWIGANDFLSVLNSSEFVNKFFDEPDSIYGKNKIIEESVAGVTSIYSALIEKGAKNFAVINLPNIGYTPYVLTTTYKKDILNDAERYKEFSIKLTQAVDEYNKHLNNKIEEINKTIENKIILIDVNLQLNNMLYGKHMFDETKSFDYGFTYLNSEVLIPNQNNIYIQKPCFSGAPLFNVTFFSYWNPNFNKTLEDFERTKICSNDMKAKDFQSNKNAIFWDNPHPSSYAHCFLSHFIEKTLGDNNLIAKNSLSLDEVKKECGSVINYKFSIH